MYSSNRICVGASGWCELEKITGEGFGCSELQTKQVGQAAFHLSMVYGCQVEWQMVFLILRSDCLKHNLDLNLVCEFRYNQIWSTVQYFPA